MGLNNRGGKMKNWWMLSLLWCLSSSAQALDFGDIVERAILGGGSNYQQDHDHSGRVGRRPGDGWGRRPGHDWGRRPGRGVITCSAADRGWEEHWTGHADCRECLRKHGECIESCEQTFNYRACKFEGRDRTGRTQMFEGQDEDRRQAELEAENKCFRAGYRDCRFVRCDLNQERELISRRSCGRR